MTGDEVSALLEAERHQPEPDGCGCDCGFSVWSVDHVVIYAVRAAAQHRVLKSDNTRPWRKETN